MATELKNVILTSSIKRNLLIKEIENKKVGGVDKEDE